MHTEREILPTITKEMLGTARWLGRDAEMDFSWPPRDRGYSVIVDGNTPTTLYPLRVGSFGRVLPHIYEGTVVNQDSSDGQALDHAHRLVRFRYDMNGRFDHDSTKDGFESLLRYGLKDEELIAMGVTEKVREAFDSYTYIREQRRRRVADGLTSIIRTHELFVVANNGENEDTGFVAPLVGIVNTQNGHQMRYDPVVRSQDGSIGTLPEHYHIPNGISARAA